MEQADDDGHLDSNWKRHLQRTEYRTEPAYLMPGSVPRPTFSEKKDEKEVEILVF